MGVLPLEFENKQNKTNLNILGNETISILGMSELKPGAKRIAS